MYNYAHFCFTLVARKQVCKFMLFAYIFLEMFVIIFSKRFVALISKDLFYIFPGYFFQTIIFIRDKNARGQEISGYIDYAYRLKAEDFEPYFAGRKQLLPQPSDFRLVTYTVPKIDTSKIQLNPK